MDFATASKMLEILRSPHLTKRATCAEKKHNGRRRVSCERDATETTTCSFRGEVSATFTTICEDGSSVIRDESCLLCGATTFANDRKCTSGTTRRARTSVRQLHPLDSATPSVGKVKKRRQPFTRHTGNSVQKEVDEFWCVLYSATRQRTCWLVRRAQTIGVEWRGPDRSGETDDERIDSHVL